MKSTSELIRQGIAALQAKHQEGEGAKLGNLRGGSSGVLAFGGKIAGACMRIAYLRSIGIDGNPASDDREHMFAGGRGNEDILAELLAAANEPGLSWKREEEYPMEWFTSNGTKVTGRPDVVLGRTVDGEFKGERILELKLASSLYTAKSFAIDGAPKLSHVIQATHYSQKLGLPIEIWYTSRSDYHVTEFLKKEIPKGLDVVEYNWKGDAKKILPFMQGYSLGVTTNGQVYYQRIDRKSGELGEKVLTVVTVEGIVGFFEQLSKVGPDDALPAKPSKVELDGGEAGFSLCDYCALKSTCSSYKGSSTKEWVGLVREAKDKK